MIAKDFDAISKQDIEALITNGVTEGRGIEYKQSLPQGTDEEVREFLADTSSFANADGGDLIYGIRAQLDASGKTNGLPGAIDGLTDINPDQQILRLDSLIRDGIDPRITGVRIKAVEGFPGGPILVIRVPRSWASPHMVKFKNLSRFFSRNSAGKYQLDVREIRSSVLASETLSEKLASFRANRISKILANETPAPLENVPKLVVHLLPLRAFSDSVTVDLRKADADWQTNKIKPPGHPTTYGPPQYNFNGLWISGGNGQKTTAYIQLFRNGAIEIVCARVSMNRIVIGSSFEQETLVATSLQQFQKRFELGPPSVIAISLLSAKDFIIYPHPPTGMDSYFQGKPMEENALIAPDVLIQESDTDFGRLLRPSFDAIWQASGWPGSQCYDETGKRVGIERWMA